MVKEYVLQGLCCANCGAKIENAVKNQNGVIDASVNIMSTTLKAEIADNFSENITTTIEKIVHKYEPDIVVIDKDNGSNAQKLTATSYKSEKIKMTMIIIGAAILAIGLILENHFNVNTYVEITIYLISYMILGGEVVWSAIKNIFKGQIFNENFLMSIATLGALIIGDFPEAVSVMLFYQVGEYFQEAAVRNSKKSIADLMDIRPDFAHLKRNGKIVKVSPEAVAIGDIIVVKPGEKIPLDGIILEGDTMIDATALTGESVPRKSTVSDMVLSGCINKNGVITVEVTKTFGESTVAKIIDLVENASSKKAKTENFITVFSRYYTPVVVILATLLSIIPPLFWGGVWSEWVNRGLIFLVISCPCALVVSIPLSFFGGIGKASKNGVLIKGSNYLEALNNVDIVVFDKTGTLTKGEFNVTKILPFNGFSEDALLEIAAQAEKFSNHPIALSIQKEYGKEINKKSITNYTEIAGCGISATINGKRVLAGNQKLMETENISLNNMTNFSVIGTTVNIAVENILAGCIVISDEIKEDSHKAIKSLKNKGIKKTVMLTGDHSQIANAIASELGIDEVYSGLLPNEKVEKVEILSDQKNKNGKLAFVGDGINDAPVLARADIGIAMGGLGSDAAIEAADVVLMTDEPSKLAEAIDIAKATKRIVWQNIIFALGIKGVFLILGAFGVANMWEAVFADVGVSVLAILNSMRLLRK